MMVSSRRLRLVVGAALASIALCFAATPNASALSIGIMSGGNAWQETSQ
jgi:hypothetical protein